MANLSKHRDNYSTTSENLRNYYRDEVNYDENGNDNANIRIKNNKKITSKSFEYNTKQIGSTPNNNNTFDTEVVAPLKFLSNFWRSLNLPLINCEIELDLSWSSKCVISEILRKFRVVGDPLVQQVATATTEATFQINNLYFSCYFVDK